MCPDVRLPRPIICLVTDRRRLVPPGNDQAAVDCLVRQIRAAIHCGIDVVQVRERDLSAADLFRLVTAAVAAARGTATRIVVNDRIDVALAAHADGVHLRADSIGPAAARRLAPPPFLIGRSVHSASEAAACADHVDYLIAGTVFPTASKPADTRSLDVSGLAEIVAAARVMPVLAIGGVTLDAIPRIAAAGAAGFAAIGLFVDQGEQNPPCRISGLQAVVAEARRRFDSVNTAS